MDGRMAPNLISNLQAVWPGSSLSSQQDAHVRSARNSDRSPRSHTRTYVASRKGARSASGMQSCWLDKVRREVATPAQLALYIVRHRRLSDVVKPSFEAIRS